MEKKAPTPVDRHIGSRVRRRRIALGMSQETLGEALGLTFQQVQKYEKGTNRIGASRLLTIATILKVGIEFFFDGLAETRATSSAETRLMGDFLALPECERLMRSLVSLSDEDRRQVSEFLDWIAGRLKATTPATDPHGRP